MITTVLDHRPFSRLDVHVAWQCILLVATALSSATAAEYRIVERIDIDTVPSAFPVGFCLLTHGRQQFVAYYNANHQMMVAVRQIGQSTWKKVELPSKVGWDSHNYVTMAIDSAGNIHVSGNMHCVPLIYFRTRIPSDITTFERRPMTGDEEQRCTYPHFLHDADDNLLFIYRSGQSGNGKRFINRYDVKTGSWRRFLDTPLFDGQGKCNAYPLGPVRGPHGDFHLVWVWRDTPDCATNHDLSYARSRNLKDWTSAGGIPARLPMTLEQSDLCVDPIPTGGGIINGCEKLTFDAAGRPVIAYHKRDARGAMQIFIARPCDGLWKSTAVTKWDKRIEFSGRGAMPFIGIRIASFGLVAPGVLGIRYRHRDYGSGWIFLDEATLATVPGPREMIPTYPPELLRPTLAFPGMRVKLAVDQGTSGDSATKYVLRWETLGANHDRPRRPPLPPPCPLQLITLKRDHH